MSSYELDEQVHQAGINFYARLGYWRHVQIAVKQGLKKLGNDPVMHLWNGFSQVMDSAQRPEGIRNLQKLVDSRDVGIAAVLGLIHAHKQADIVDKDAVKDLEGRFKAGLKESGEVSLHQAALVMWHTGKTDKARDIVDKMLKLNNASSDGLATRGWIDITSGRESHAKKSIKYFEEALKPFQGRSDQTHLEALLGKAEFMLSVKHNYDDALVLLNQAVALFPTFIPALIAKAWAHLALNDWDGALDTTRRCTNINPDCIPALHIQSLCILARTGQYEEAAGVLGKIITILDNVEPQSHRLYYNLSRAPARVSGRNQQVLQQTRTMLDRAMQMDNTVAVYFEEMAHQQLMRDHQGAAHKLYKKAMQLDESSVGALHGIIHCQILIGQLDDAQTQLDFLSEIQASAETSAELCYLRALLSSKRNDPVPDTTKLLDTAVKAHLTTIKTKAPSPTYFLELQPELLVSIAKLYLQYAPAHPPTSGDAASPILDKASMPLEALVKLCPGCIEAAYLLARVRFLSGDLVAAQSGAQHCLKMNTGFTEAHLLMAEIQLAMGNYGTALQALQNGLSYNFEIRDLPLYHVLQARIHLAEDKTTDALKSMQAAMKIPGVRKVVQNTKTSRPVKRSAPVTDRVTVFLTLADVHIAANRLNDAAKVLTEAENQFRDTAEAVRVTLAQSELALKRGDVEGALDLLRGVGREEPYYIQAKEKMAHIYLHHRKDKRVYAACYKELVEQNPTSHSYLLLGDAYMAIQEPDKAINVYETALKQNPRDGTLASKIGAALVRTHDFNRAIKYYEAAVKNGEQPHLRSALAELHLKLKNFDKAKRVLEDALASSNQDTIEGMVQTVKDYEMLARVHKQSTDISAAIDTLQRARKLQSQVISRVSAEQPESLKQQQQTAAELSFQIAKYYEEDEHNYSKATAAYQEALSFDQANSRAMLALAKLHLDRGDLEAAQFQLSPLLQQGALLSAQEQGEAAMMMADIMFRKHEYDSATFHLQQLLDKQPEHYEALSRLIDLNRRAGKLDACDKYITQAETACARPETEPGLNYCRGVLRRYQQRPNEALKALNKARKDSDYGVKALYHMVEICLNPDDTSLGTSEPTAAGDSASEALQMGAKTAEKLLAELASLGESSKLKYKLLQNYALAASKSKQQMEKALANFTALASEQREEVGAILGMARTYMQLKNTPKARHQLKRVTKLEWNSDDAEEFEGAWLLLSYIYINSGKYDLAQDLLKKILQHNKSCSKAWEYMGYIMEKEQSYANAAEFYENAWSFSTAADPAVGYKLAFNYLKAKRFVDAIDICHAVLKANPDYPRIRKDILEKARMGLKN
ncbi:hypothetical protein PTSG_12640 [Salpingoeca rosetta]|uniref:Tetratricopeptide repeat protein 21B n=1 Tax=Salpingoeca rosetta (strain ATCC 50818 / BSB-021) TaxID=946362 RepID=F2UGD8_SALR5|nr:uncharacterized protein PTSG_12640 [Salpingoeca rosetta]EGD75688.1 hypothetical protein PTSG_12640 [Salpingoeca rosetta]|eukprot:XP_004991609.1 hypothetical protein PTSG_12640 [Salpingoeca rosetta]